MNEELHRLGEEYWEYSLEVGPTTALMLGDHRHDDRMEDTSRAAEDAHIARLRSFVAAAEAIDPTTLTPDEQVTREVLIFSARTEAETDETRPAELAVNPAVGFQAMLPVMVPQFPIELPEHAEALVAKYRALGPFFDQMAERLREGVAAGRTPPDLMVDKTAAQLDAYLASSPAEDVLLDVRAPAAFDAAAVAKWKDQLLDAIIETIRPAYQRYRDVVVNEVRPTARPIDKPGLSWLPDGEATYARCVYRYTSLPMDPREIHEIGRQQIARLNEEYRALGQAVLGTTDLPGIYALLRDDPGLHFDNGPEIVAASEAAMAKAKAAMGDWFGRLPQTDCLVSETPSGPMAFYFPPAADGSRPGTFFVNTSDPSAWGRHEIESMAFHEGIPGHHLQLAIAQELEGIPEFRKHEGVTAYAEGWGLYTERLADEMGLFTSDLERMGMLSADSLRAGRLVVDTGMHALGWSRDEAIQFFADNSPLTMATIEGEVDRYIGIPGQALAYMIGRLEILELRAAAEAAMGDAFDIKGFHDTVLGSGMVPLETLGRMVREWSGAA